MSNDPRPNVLLITTDQQRYDMLGANGNPQVRTPHLDALAARGALFRHAYIQNTVCIPSRACLQTGRYTHQHGVTYMESVIDFTTDHGEMMFERGRLGKGNFNESVIHAPLIVVPPGGIVGGQEVEELVETYDIAPTVLDYARAEIPDTMSAIAC